MLSLRTQIYQRQEQKTKQNGEVVKSSHGVQWAKSESKTEIFERCPTAEHVTFFCSTKLFSSQNIPHQCGSHAVYDVFMYYYCYWYVYSLKNYNTASIDLRRSQNNFISTHDLKKLIFHSFRFKSMLSWKVLLFICV